MTIKKVQNLNITILLGNFHTQASFQSAIGYVMKNSGIKEVFSTVYVENPVEKNAKWQILQQVYESQ